MTSLENSKVLSRKHEEICPKCGGPVSLRQEYPFPVVIQLCFAVSFVAFILLIDKLRANVAWHGVMWVWCAVQVVLGVLLVQRRLRARKRVYRCIRCGQAVP